MIALTLKEIAAIVDGAIDAADADNMVARVVTDSRLAGPGALFVALAGEHVDGHTFARDALSRGAAGVLVRDGSSESLERSIGVADPLMALRAIAAANRSRLRARVVAITGSSGKTTAKELTAAAMRAGGKATVASEASYNNEIGVPLTVLSADETTDVLVAEVGSRGLGHIAALAPVVRPHVSVVLGIGAAHVGEFGSIEITARAKAELVEALEDDGVAILNADDHRTTAMASRAPRAMLFGTGTGADVRATDIVLDDAARASFVVGHAGRSAEVVLRIPGEHTVTNALAAIAAAVACGVPLDAAARGLAGVEAPAGRMRIVQAGARTIVDDAYNANPDSVRAALKTLRVLGGSRPTVAVLGVMAELGDSATEEHDGVGRLAARLGISRVIAVGQEARAVCEAARLEGMLPEEAVSVADAEDAVGPALEAGDDAVILVKASRAARLERVVEALTGGPA